MIEYDKLIRDRIPEIIERSGKKCIVEVMDDDTYLQYLDQKLNPVSVSDAQIILCYYTDCLANSSISKLDITDYVKEYYPNFVK